MSALAIPYIKCALCLLVLAFTIYSFFNLINILHNSN